MQSRTSSGRMKTLFPYPQFQNFVEDVQTKRNKIFMDLLKEKDLKKSISESYQRRKEIIPQNLKKKDEVVIKSIHRYFMKRKSEAFQDYFCGKENSGQNLQQNCLPINRKLRTKIHRNSREKWNMLMTPEEKNSVLFGNQRALEVQVRAKYLNQQKLQKLKREKSRHRSRPLFVSMYQKREP